MKACVLFLHGRYSRADIPFYKKLCRGRFTVAVDAGYRFFRIAGVVPDLLIGDFDSLKRIPRGVSSRTAVERFPEAKDKTDAQLALEYCLDRRAPVVDIVQPSFGEPDQFVGNLMLLTVALRRAKRGYRPEVRIVNRRYEAVVLDNESRGISRGKGEMVSVVPLSERVRYSCRGTEYDVTNVPLRQGDTRTLRNRIVSGRARFEVKGRAFLIHQTGRGGA